MVEFKSTLNPEEQKAKFRKWAIILCIFAFILNYFSIALGGDIYNVLALQFPDYSKSQISYMMTIGAAIAIPMFFFGGTAMRKIDPRYIMVPAVILAGAMLFWMPRTSSYPQLMTCIVLMTIGMKVFDFCVFGVVSNWFLTQRGRMLGYITVATPLASATFTNFSTRLGDTIGPVVVFGTLGAFVVAIGVLCWFFFPRSPETKNVYPDGFERSPDEIARLKTVAAPKWTSKEILTNKMFWLYALSFGILSLLMAAVMPLFVPRMLSVGIERNMALNLMSVAAILGMFISVIWGWIDDKLGTPVACTILCVCYFFMMMGIRLQAPNSIWLYISVFGISFGTGGIPNLNASLCAYIFGREQYMNIMRFAQPVQQLIRLISLVMMAFFYDTYGSYDKGYNICIVLAAVAIVLIVLIGKKTYDPERISANGVVKGK